MILVIGDFILDEFYYGQATRISPEAPNLVLDLDEIKRVKGGAYNVVEHLRNLDNKVQFVSLLGRKNILHNDTKNLFSKYDKIVYDESRLESVKARMVARYRHTTLLRVDQEDRTEISERQECHLIEIIEKTIGLGTCKGVCIIDYCKGVVTKGLAEHVIKSALSHGVKTYVDTKSRNIDKFAGAYFLKPNKNEFSLLKSLYGSSRSSDELFCDYLYKSLMIENILRTLGEDGIELYSKGKKIIEVKGHNCDVKELSGAGDSVLAGTVHLHSKGMPLRLAVARANKAASIFVSNGVEYRICKTDLE
jgi:rfaE bifunctional protein kinase chain/domain